MTPHRSKAIIAALLHTRMRQMKRFWMLPLAALTVVGVASVAQAAPGSRLLGTLKAIDSQTAGKADLVNWRWYRHHRHHRHYRNYRNYR